MSQYQYVSSQSAFTFGVTARSFSRNDHRLLTTPCCWKWLESEHWRLLGSYLDLTKHIAAHTFYISLSLRQSGDEVNHDFVCALERWILKNWFNYTTIIKGICRFLPYPSSIAMFNNSLSSARPPPEFGPITTKSPWWVEHVGVWGKYMEKCIIIFGDVHFSVQKCSKHFENYASDENEIEWWMSVEWSRRIMCCWELSGRWLCFLW